MARVGATVDKLELRAAAASQPEPTRAAAMSSVVSYESLVHAVSGAVVSGRGGAGRGSCESGYASRCSGFGASCCSAAFGLLRGSPEMGWSDCWAARQGGGSDLRRSGELWMDERHWVLWNNKS